MITARCMSCNYVARYNSNYFVISELKRHAVAEITTEQSQCVHELRYREEKEN